MVNNHGDRKSPRPGVVGPLPNGLYKWLITGGDPNHLLTGMILQVNDFESALGSEPTIPIRGGRETQRALLRHVFERHPTHHLMVG